MSATGSAIIRPCVPSRGEAEGECVASVAGGAQIIDLCALVIDVNKAWFWIFREQSWLKKPL